MEKDDVYQVIDKSGKVVMSGGEEMIERTWAFDAPFFLIEASVYDRKGKELAPRSIIVQESLGKGCFLALDESWNELVVRIVER